MNTEETIYLVLDLEAPVKDCIWSACRTKEQAEVLQKVLLESVTDPERLVSVMPILLEGPGLGVPQGSPQDRSEAQPECGPAQSATPKESVICVEALEKEGWKEQQISSTRVRFDKWPFQVYFWKGECDGVGTEELNFEGASTMQDLRTLERLVNGELK